jgi:integrase
VPRKVRDANLETRTARSRLKAQHKPYFRLIESGLHVAYRKLTSGPGTWGKRQYLGNGEYRLENLRTADGGFVLADDYEDADGERILSFTQAQRAARGPKRPAAGAYTVADTITDYLTFLEHDGRSPHSIRDARYRIEAFVLPRLGNVKLPTLTADQLRHWRDEIAKAPARIRTRDGDRQRHREIAGEDTKRARHATANRTWTVLRAALNHAFHEGKTDSDHAWRRVKPFRNVEAARIRYLSVTESRRLANAADATFRPLIIAALQTGARFSELARLEVADFDLDAGRLRIRQSKSGRSRHIVLSTEGRELFSQWCAGRASGTLIFTRANGQPWQKSMQARPMRAACERARIKPTISFHILRHTHGSALAMAGVPMAVIAEQLGHAGTRMTERHYSHLSPSYVADRIRKGLPSFGFRTDKRIVPLAAGKPANA